MTLNQPFTIASIARTLAEFKKLPPQRQGEAFLRRLAHHFPRGKTFLRSNLALPNQNWPDPYGLCTGWPFEELREGVLYLLDGPWRTIARADYIADALSGKDWYEITPDAWLVVEQTQTQPAPDRDKKEVTKKEVTKRTITYEL